MRTLSHKGANLGPRQFRELARDYQPASYEIESQNERVQIKFGENPSNLVINYQRFYYALKAALGFLSAKGESECVVADFGGYPGTMVKLLALYLDKAGIVKPRVQIIGFVPHGKYRKDMEYLGVELIDCEFDVRKNRTGKHILDLCPAVDIGLCMEVIEHQYNPISLLVGVNRALRLGGSLC